MFVLKDMRRSPRRIQRVLYWSLQVCLMISVLSLMSDAGQIAYVGAADSWRRWAHPCVTLLFALSAIALAIDNMFHPAIAIRRPHWRHEEIRWWQAPWIASAFLIVAALLIGGAGLGLLLIGPV